MSKEGSPREGLQEPEAANESDVLNDKLSAVQQAISRDRRAVEERELRLDHLCSDEEHHMKLICDLYDRVTAEILKDAAE